MKRVITELLTGNGKIFCFNRFMSYLIQRKLKQSKKTKKSNNERVYFHLQ